MKGRFQSIVTAFKQEKQKKRRMKVILDFEENEDFFNPHMETQKKKKSRRSSRKR